MLILQDVITVSRENGGVGREVSGGSAKPGK